MGKNDVLTEDRFYYLMTKFYQNFLSTKFDQLEEGLGGKIDGLGERMEKVEERLGNVEERMVDVEERMGNVEEKIDRMDIKLDRVAEIVTDSKTNHEIRIRRLEKKVGLTGRMLVN